MYRTIAKRLGGTDSESSSALDKNNDRHTMNISIITISTPNITKFSMTSCNNYKRITITVLAIYSKASTYPKRALHLHHYATWTRLELEHRSTSYIVVIDFYLHMHTRSVVCILYFLLIYGPALQLYA